jgi:endoglycosylceramidase
MTLTIDRGFAHMKAKADEWGSPLFVGEFGAPAGAARAGEYMDYLYDHLDRALASGTQWNYAPTWTDRAKDGWNGEDFNVLSPDGAPRPNFAGRPYPQRVAGAPLRFAFHRAPAPSLELVWDNRPELGETEVFVPSWLFPPTSTLTIDGEAAGARSWRDFQAQRLILQDPTPGVVRVRFTSGLPGPGGATGQ